MTMTNYIESPIARLAFHFCVFFGVSALLHYALDAPVWAAIGLGLVIANQETEGMCRP